MLKVLISIWGKRKVQEELDGAVRNKTIFVGIQEKKKLAKQGYDCDWQQCRSKKKNLKGDYRKVKDNNGETGRGRKTCKFYSELDSILSKRETELEEKRRKDKREHEMRMIQLLGQMIAPRERAHGSYHTHHPSHPQAFNYDYDEY